MIIDDLDFFLLDIVSLHSHGLTLFDFDNLGECVNRRLPRHARLELIAALRELFERGDLEATLTSPNGRQSKPFVPNQDEIAAGIAGALQVAFRLSAQGGEKWSQAVNVDWSRWNDDCWSDSRLGCITAASRELAEFLYEREVRQGLAKPEGRRKELRPWRPTYWHEEPVGYEVRYRLRPEQPAPHDWFAPVWLGRLPSRRSVTAIATRRQRSEPLEQRPFQERTEKQLERLLRERGQLVRLAAASELALRPDSNPLLIKLLERPCPAVRHAAAKALGKCRMKQAVPALMGALLKHHDSAAAEALGHIGDKCTLPALLNLLKWWRGHSQLPAAIARAIIQFGDPGIERLEKLVRKTPRLRSVLLYALSHSKSPRTLESLCRYMPSDHWPVAELLAGMGHDARTELYRFTGSETELHARTAAAFALSESPGIFQQEASQVSETLQRQRQQNFLQMKISLSVSGSANTGVEHPVADLVARLQHPSCGRRRAAVDLLAELDIRSAAPAVARLAADDRWQVRASVARALARWGEPEAELSQLRKDPDVIVRGCTRWFTAE